MALFNIHTSIQNSGILQGFTDWHSHILPGVDDGIKDVEDSINLLDEYEKAGIREVWLTPHVMEDIPNKTATLKQVYADLRTRYNGSVRLCLGAEYLMDSLFEDRLDAGDLLPLEGRRLLLETSLYNPPSNFHEILQKVRNLGYTPVLAHPERSMYMGDDELKSLKEKGVTLLLDLPSLCGVHGEDVRERAERILSGGMYDICGTASYRLSGFSALRESKLANRIIRQIPR